MYAEKVTRRKRRLPYGAATEIAHQLGVSPQFVALVAKRKGTSKRVLDAIDAYLAERRKTQGRGRQVA